VGQGTKANSRDVVTSQLPKAGVWWITELVPGGLRVILKTELFYIAGEGAEQSVLQE
jgi:hypothetical protein